MRIQITATATHKPWYSVHSSQFTAVDPSVRAGSSRVRSGFGCRGAGRSRAYRLQGRSDSFVNALSSHLLLCTYVVLCPRSGFDSLSPCSYLFDFSSPTCVCGCVYACVSAGRRRTDRVIGLHGSRRPFSLASLAASPDCVVGDLG